MTVDNLNDYLSGRTVQLHSGQQLGQKPTSPPRGKTTNATSFYVTNDT